MRKKLSVLMLVILTVSILAGCTPNELEFYSLIKQISNLEMYETEGEITVDISGSLIEDMANEDPIAENGMAFMDGLVIKYKGQQSLKQNKALMSFAYKNKENPEFSDLTTIIMDEGSLYLEIDQLKDLLIDLVRAEDVETALELEEALKDIDYISMNQSEMGDLYYAENQTEIVDAYFNILDFIPEMFKNFDSKTVTKKGNKLTYEINTENVLDIIENFLTYIAKNDKEIIRGINKIIDAIPADIALESKEELKNSILYEDFKTNMDELLLELKENRGVIENTLLNMFQGSKITYSIKKENNIFQIESDINLNLNDGFQTFNLNVSERVNTKEIKESNFIKTISKERTMDFEDLLNILEKPQLYYTSIIYVDSQEYLFFDGDVYTDEINVIIKDNSTYLPLRRIGEDLGEEVGWNAETKTPYINRDGEMIEMKGLLVDNTAYVKLRDFEKLDYYVDWMEDTRAAYISRWYTLEEFLSMK